MTQHAIHAPGKRAFEDAIFTKRSAANTVGLFFTLAAGKASIDFVLLP
ncbi:MAG: hypothetical protein GY799_03410 [Desulfobulbaceae bacterium]|nr:hypothetical protein [Desulfobulbaceae bacterium]